MKRASRGSSAEYMGPDEERPDQQEAGSGGEGFRGLEAGVWR